MRDSEKPIPGCQLVHVALRFTEGEPGAMEGRVLGRRTSFFDKLHDRGTQCRPPLEGALRTLVRLRLELSADYWIALMVSWCVPGAD